MWGVIILLISSVGLIIMVRDWLKLPYRLAPFITSSLLILILYLGGYLDLLKPTAILLYIIGILYSVYSIVRISVLNRNKKWSVSAEAMWVLGVWSFLLILNYSIFRNFILTTWDEFSFWGMFPKLMVLFDAISTDQFLSINKAEYPRGTALYQYFFNVGLSDGNFKEWIAIFAQVSLFASFLPMLFKNFTRKGIVQNIMIAACFFCLPYVFVFPIYSLYNDAILSLFFAGAILVYYGSSDKFKGILMSSLVLCVLPLIKETGLIFGLLAWGIMAADWLFFRNSIRKWRTWMWILSGLLIMFLSKASWDEYVKISKISANTFKLDVEEILKSDLKPYQITSVENFKRSVFFIGNVNKYRKTLDKEKDEYIATSGTPIYFNSKVRGLNNLFGTEWKLPHSILYKINIRLSLFYWLGIYVLIFSFLIWKGSISGKDKIFTGRKNMVAVLGISVIGAVLYTILLLVLYLYSFFEWEAIRLASYERYVGTMLMGLYLLLLFLIIKSGKKRFFIPFFLFILLFIPDRVFDTFAERERLSYHQNVLEENKVLDSIYAPIADKLELKSSRILLINQTGRGLRYTQFKFRSFPIRSDGYSYHPTEKVVPRTKNYSKEDFKSLLRRCDYMVILQDSLIWEGYGPEIYESDIKGIWTQTEGWMIGDDIKLIKDELNRDSINEKEPSVLKQKEAK